MSLVSPVVAASLTLLLVTAGDTMWMSEPDLTATFGGQVVDGHYADGKTFTESYLADGSIDYREAKKSQSGRWSVSAGTFCTIYSTTPTGGCYRVHRASANCFEFYFMARDARRAAEPGRKPDWTARAWLTSRPSTCQEGAAV